MHTVYIYIVSPSEKQEEWRDLCEMPHKALIDAMLCSHTVSAQIRAQQATSNDLGQVAHMAASATCNNIPYV